MSKWSKYYKITGRIENLDILHPFFIGATDCRKGLPEKSLLITWFRSTDRLCDLYMGGLRLNIHLECIYDDM